MTTTKQAHPFSGATRKPPTLKHRPVIWECMLGTIYAQSPTGEVKYFDYDWDGARAFAQVTPESDPRVARPNQCPRSASHVTYRDAALPGTLRRSQLALWITEAGQ